MFNFFYLQGVWAFVTWGWWAFKNPIPYVQHMLYKSLGYLCKTTWLSVLLVCFSRETKKDPLVAGTLTHKRSTASIWTTKKLCPSEFVAGHEAGRSRVGGVPSLRALAVVEAGSQASRFLEHSQGADLCFRPREGCSHTLSSLSSWRCIFSVHILVFV